MAGFNPRNNSRIGIVLEASSGLRSKGVIIRRYFSEIKSNNIFKSEKSVIDFKNCKDMDISKNNYNLSLENENRYIFIKNLDFFIDYIFFFYS